MRNAQNMGRLQHFSESLSYFMNLPCQDMFNKHQLMHINFFSQQFILKIPLYVFRWFKPPSSGGRKDYFA
jgi:hypothetical protein